MKAIGIDIGTTSICGVILDAETGALLKSETVESRAFIQTEHLWERIQDVSRILTAATGILEGFLAEYPEDVLSIGLTGQMHGIVYVDADGKAVSPLYTWQDGRGNLPYKDSTYAEYLNSCSGYGNVTDFYNRENGLIPESARGYCTIMDYLGMVLCGRKSPRIHPSNAASMGLYDMEASKFTYTCPAEIAGDFEILGNYRGIPVSVAIGDNQASVFASLANEHDLLINVGTGSQISVVSSRPIFHQNLECRPYFGGKYLIVGNALCGGRAYSMLKDFYKALFDRAHIRDVDIYKLMADMCQDKDSTTLHVDTRFAGTRSDTSVKGSISSITTQNLTPADLTLGVLTGMATELFDMYTAIGESRKGIVGSGNGIRKNPVLCKIVQRVFGSSLRVSAYTEEASCGAALFAMVACGKYAGITDVQKRIHYTDIPSV